MLTEFKFGNLSQLMKKNKFYRSRFFLSATIVAIFSIASVPIGLASHAIAHLENPSDQHLHEEFELGDNFHSDLTSFQTETLASLQQVDSETHSHHHIVIASCPAVFNSSLTLDPNLLICESPFGVVDAAILSLGSRQINRGKDPPLQTTFPFLFSPANKAPPAA